MEYLVILKNAGTIMARTFPTLMERDLIASYNLLCNTEGN